MQICKVNECALESVIIKGKSKDQFHEISNADDHDFSLGDNLKLKLKLLNCQILQKFSKIKSSNVHIGLCIRTCFFLRVFTEF